MGDELDPDEIGFDADEARSEVATKEPRKRRAPRKATAKYLERAGLAYIERFAPPKASLIRILRGKVTRSLRVHGGDPQEGEAIIQALAVKFEAAGLLNDALYAASRARRLFSRGHPRRVIAQKLREKGLAADDIDAALSDFYGDEANSDMTHGDMIHGDLAAALTYARKRRLGPFGPPAGRAERHPRDLAILARRGFSYDIAMRVLGEEFGRAFEDDLTG